MEKERLPVVEEPTLPSITADYLTEFRCIGPDCEDSCCAGWTTVSIDLVTLGKYREVKNPELKKKLDELIIQDTTYEDGRERWKIKMTERHTCPFHTKEKLCEIQCKLGERHLSSTCGLYPRISNLVSGVFERSATLSCPEITRLVLFRPQGIRFVVDPMRLNWSDCISNAVGDEYDEPAGSVRANHIALFRKALAIVQDRSVSTFARVIALGKFTERVRDALEDGIPARLAALLERYESGIPEDERVKLERTPRAVDAQVAFLLEIVNLLLKRPVLAPRFSRCFSAVMNGLRLAENLQLEEIAKHFKNAQSQYADPYFKKHDFVFENYLANHMFKNMFPCTNTTGLMDEYLTLIIPLIALRLQLIGMSGAQHGLTNDAVVTLFQSFSKSFDHNSVMMGGLLASLRGSDFASLEYVELLLA